MCQAKECHFFIKYFLALYTASLFFTLLTHRQPRDTLQHYSMPVKEFQTPYPVIDTDPKFTRVIRYFRASDYAAWAAATAIAPALLLTMGELGSETQ